MKTANSLLFSLSFLVIFSLSSCKKNEKKQGSNAATESTLSSENVYSTPSTDKLYERLMASFGKDWMEREGDPDLYPDYYGGAFVDNSGIFRVAVTGRPEAHQKQLQEILGTDNFKIETVQYSFAQMMRVMDKIDAFLVNSEIPDDHPLLTRFAGAFPDVMQNRVIVRLTVTDDATTRLFQKDVVNSPLIVFEKGELPAMM